MNKKARVLLIGTVLAITGIVMKGTKNANANLPENLSTEANYTSISSELNNIDSIAQYGGSPWGQVVNPKTYTNPDTGQKLCFYSSSRWAPCPGQGDEIIVVPGGKCRGGKSWEEMGNFSPAASCSMDRISKEPYRAVAGAEESYSEPSCTGLP